MVFESRKIRKSQFTDDSPTLASLFDFIKSGVNKKATLSELMDLVADVFGASLRTYEFESELVADDIELGEYAIVEENTYSLYKVTQTAAADRDVALNSGLVATFESYLKEPPSLTTYDEFRNDDNNFRIDDFPDNTVVTFVGDGIAGDFAIKSGASPADNGGTIIRSNIDSNRYAERVRANQDPINVAWFDLTDDWNGTTGTDNLAAFTNAFAAGNNILIPPSTLGYYISSRVSKATDDIHISAYGAIIAVGGAQNDSGFVFGSSAADSEPNHSGLLWEGGIILNSAPTDVVDRQLIAMSGVEKFVFFDIELRYVSNGGILLRAGCRNGLIEKIKIGSISSNTTVRGIWLNGGDATDYQTELVDEQSITRNATALPVGGLRNITIRKCEIKIPRYNIYLMNAQYTTIENCDLDIQTATLRNVTVNTYSPYTKILNNIFNSSAPVGNKGILITQFSHDVLIQGNTFKGDYGTSQTIHPTYLSHVNILDNNFAVDNSIPIVAEMGAYGRIAGNTFGNPIETAKTAGDRCFRVYTIGNFESTQSNFGNTATTLKGWIFENNDIYTRNGGCQITQQADFDTANEVGIDSVIVKNNRFHNWDDVSNSDEYPLKVSSITTPANVVYYGVQGNITIPSANGFEERNRADDPNGAAVNINSTAQQAAYGEGDWTLVITDSSNSGAEGQTTSLNVGRWIRNGNLCTVYGRFTMSSLGTLTTSDQVRIGGLPFTVSSTANMFWPVHCCLGAGLSIASGTSVAGHAEVNTTYLKMTNWDVATGTSSLLLSQLTASGSLTFVCSYEIDDLTPQ